MEFCSCTAACTTLEWQALVLAAEVDPSSSSPAASHNLTALRSALLTMRASAAAARSVLDGVATPLLSELLRVDDAAGGGQWRRHRCRVLSWLCAHASLCDRSSCAGWMLDTLRTPSGGSSDVALELQRQRLGLMRFIAHALRSTARQRHRCVAEVVTEDAAAVPRYWTPASRAPSGWGVDVLALCRGLMAHAAAVAPSGAPTRLAVEALNCVALLLSDLAQRSLGVAVEAATDRRAATAAAAALWELCTDGSEPIAEALLLQVRKRAPRSTNALLRSGIDDLLIAMQQLCTVGWDIELASRRQREKLAQLERDGGLSAEERGAVEERADAADSRARMQVQRALAWNWSTAAPAIMGADTMLRSRSRGALRRSHESRVAAVAECVAQLAQQQIGEDEAEARSEASSSGVSTCSADADAAVDLRRAVLRSTVLWIGGAASRTARYRDVRKRSLELCSVAAEELRSRQQRRSGTDAASTGDDDARDACDALAVALLREVRAAESACDRPSGAEIAAPHGRNAAPSAVLILVSSAAAISRPAAMLAAEFALQDPEKTRKSIFALLDTHPANALEVLTVLADALQPTRRGGSASMALGASRRAKCVAIERTASEIIARLADDAKFLRVGIACIFSHPLLSPSSLIPHLIAAAADDAEHVRTTAVAALRASLLLTGYCDGAEPRAAAVRLSSTVRALFETCARFGSSGSSGPSSGSGKKSSPSSQHSSPSSLAAMMDAVQFAAGVAEVEAGSSGLRRVDAIGRYVVPLLPSLLAEAVVLHRNTSRRSTWPELAAALTQLCLDAPRNLMLVKVFRVVAPLMTQCRSDDIDSDCSTAVASLVWPILQQRLSNQQELDEAMLLGTESDGDAGSGALQSLLFQRLSPLLLMKMLPAQFFAVLPSTDGAPSELAALLWRRMVRAYEFDEVRRAAAEAMARLPFSDVVHFCCTALALWPEAAEAESTTESSTKKMSVTEAHHEVQQLSSWMIGVVMDDVPLRATAGGAALSKSNVVEVIAQPAVLISAAMQTKLVVYSLLQSLLTHFDAAATTTVDLETVGDEISIVLRSLLRILCASFSSMVCSAMVQSTSMFKEVNKLQRGCIDCLAYLLHLAIINSTGDDGCGAASGASANDDPAPELSLRGMLPLMIALITTSDDCTDFDGEILAPLVASFAPESTIPDASRICFANVLIRTADMLATPDSTGKPGEGQRLLLQRAISARSVMRNSRTESALLSAAAGSSTCSTFVRSACLQVLFRLSYPAPVNAPGPTPPGIVEGKRAYIALPRALRLQQLAEIALAALRSSSDEHGVSVGVLRAGVRLLGSVLAHLAADRGGSGDDDASVRAPVVENDTLDAVQAELRAVVAAALDPECCQLATKLCSALAAR